MESGHFLKTRVSLETKRAVQAVAQKDLLTESLWLRRVIHVALQRGGFAAAPTVSDTRWRKPESRSHARLSVTLRPDDRQLLHERAVARGMPEATYVSVLVRAHLRDLTPLPKEELLALKRAGAELGAVGRNLNQVARAMNSGRSGTGVSREDLRAILKVCEALRDHVKSLIKVNAISWESGYAPSSG